jgi:N-acetylmuramoyl-L-alanine amidase
LLPDIDFIRRWHMGQHPESPYVDDPMSDIGYHWIIEKIRGHYQVIAGRMENEYGGHTLGHNFDTLGVCLVGNFDEAPPPQEQWDLAVRFVRSRRYVFAIPKNEVYGHRELQANRTCPGKFFDMDKFRAAI